MVLRRLVQDDGRLAGVVAAGTLRKLKVSAL